MSTHEWCPVCWSPQLPEDWTMADEWPEPPPGYSDEVHPGCQKMMDEYMEELYRDRRQSSGWL